MSISTDHPTIFHVQTYQSQQMLLSRYESSLPVLSSTHTILIKRIKQITIKGAYSIDQAIASRRRNPRHLMEESFFQRERRFMEPIHHDDRSDINIPIGGTRPVDDNGAEEPIAILHREMTVVPSGTILGGLEPIRERVSGRNRTLRDGHCTIGMH